MRVLGAARGRGWGCGSLAETRVLLLCEHLMTARDAEELTRMQIYLDTEFTSLEAPRLISLALVADDERSLYLELDPAGWREHASDFVVTEVMPLLEGRGVSPAEAAARIRRWIDALPEPGQIVCDSDYDSRLLRELLDAHGGWPEQLAEPCVLPWTPELGQLISVYHLRNPGRRHHAR